MTVPATSLNPAPRTQAPLEQKLHYPALDGIRAIAVLMVFAIHYQSMPWGWVGVDVFFVLSGFLITGILYDTRNARHRFRNFYVRRTLRIFPLYYAILLFLAATTPLFHWAWNRAWIYWATYLGNYVRFIYIDLLVPGGPSIEALKGAMRLRQIHAFDIYLGHFWSLCIEEQFYLLWPLVVFMVKSRRTLIKICLATVVILPFARLVATYLIPQRMLDAEMLYRLTPFRVDALLLGGLLALCLRGDERHLIRRFGGAAFVVVVALFFIVYGVNAFYFHVPHPDIPSCRWVSSFGFTMIDMMSAGLIFFSLSPETLAYRVFSLKPLRKLGQVSYGFYVFHDIPHQIYAFFENEFYRMAHPGAWHVPVSIVALCCTVALSFLSYRFFETPFLRLKDRFSN